MPTNAPTPPDPTAAQPQADAERAHRAQLGQNRVESLINELESYEANAVIPNEVDALDLVRKRILLSLNGVLRDNKINDISGSGFLESANMQSPTDSYQQVRENTTISQMKEVLKQVESRLAMESGNARVQMWGALSNDLASYEKPVQAAAATPTPSTTPAPRLAAHAGSGATQEHKEEKGFHPWNWFWHGKGIVEKKDPKAGFVKNLALSAKEELLAALLLGWGKFTGASKMVVLGARYVIPVHKLFWKKTIPYIARKLTIFEDEFWMKGGKGGSSNSSSGHH